jgi:hypothetical protein
MMLSYRNPRRVRIGSEMSLAISRPTLRPFGSLSAGGALGPGRACRAAQAIRPIRTCFAIGALGAGISVGSRVTRSTGRATGTGRTDRSRSSGSSITPSHIASDVQN